MSGGTPEFSRAEFSRPEFSRPERVDTIGTGTRAIAIAADAAEHAALAVRFGLVSIETLTAAFTLRRDATGILAAGRVQARLIQRCGVTGEPVPARIDETVALRFVPAGDADAEMELDADDLDVLTYEGGAIDLGEAAAETMALALDPFPRGPGAATALRAAGVLSEEEAAPVGALAAALREGLGGKPGG